VLQANVAAVNSRAVELAIDCPENVRRNRISVRRREAESLGSLFGAHAACQGDLLHSGVKDSKLNDGQNHHDQDRKGKDELEHNGPAARFSFSLCAATVIASTSNGMRHGWHGVGPAVFFYPP
jgi:hypothetical protein